jgi:hypothetical protein
MHPEMGAVECLAAQPDHHTLHSAMRTDLATARRHDADRGQLLGERAR